MEARKLEQAHCFPSWECSLLAMARAETDESETGHEWSPALLLCLVGPSWLLHGRHLCRRWGQRRPGWPLVSQGGSPGYRPRCT